VAVHLFEVGSGCLSDFLFEGIVDHNLTSSFHLNTDL
jgi:hypothetical protein